MTAGFKKCSNTIFMDFQFIYIHNQQRKRGDWGRNGFPAKRIRGARCLQRRAIEYQSISVLIFSNNYNTLAMCWFDKNRETFSFHTFMHGLFCTLHACLKKWEREDERSINDEFLQISFASLKIFCWNFTSRTMNLKIQKNHIEEL